jgi:hypothetical protein
VSETKWEIVPGHCVDCARRDGERACTIHAIGECDAGPGLMYRALAPDLILAELLTALKAVMAYNDANNPPGTLIEWADCDSRERATRAIAKAEGKA